MPQKLCLQSNDFQDDVTRAFGSLREDTDFADVTLVSEDGEQLKAHKVILAASSPFLQPQVHSCSLKSILEIYLVFILRFILIACQQVDT